MIGEIRRGILNRRHRRTQHSRPAAPAAGNDVSSTATTSLANDLLHGIIIKCIIKSGYDDDLMMFQLPDARPGIIFTINIVIAGLPVTMCCNIDVNRAASHRSSNGNRPRIPP
jgi:hypothetical protein